MFINNNNVVSPGVNVKFNVVSSDQSEVTVKGLYSPVICKVPKYINFKNLLQNEGQVIRRIPPLIQEDRQHQGGAGLALRQ